MPCPLLHRLVPPFICHLLKFSFLVIREDPVDFEKGAQHIMRYSAIAPLLANGSVALI